MFLQASVCPRRQGGVSVSVHSGIPHPQPPGADTLQWQTPPRADTPQKQTSLPRSRHPSPEADTPKSRHPPEADTPPRADTSQEQTPPRSRHRQKQIPPQEQTPPEIWPLLQTVRILLECILVLYKLLMPILPTLYNYGKSLWD